MNKKLLDNSAVEKFQVFESISVKEAMRQMDRVARKILFVASPEGKLLGSLSDGDIRRYVLAEGNLNDAVKKVYNRKPSYVTEGYSKKEVKKLMIEKNIEWIPVLNSDNEIVDIILWDRIFGEDIKKPNRKIDLPVVIMAGGKGTRLDPFTRILPKPLIPIGEKAIIEVIMDKFAQFGVEEFHISINHKSRMIKAYFEESNTPYRLQYIEESKPMGTVGSLKSLEGKIQNDILVSNCDIIIECDYAELVDFHKTKGNDLTIVGSFRHFTIPYGICTIEDGGQLSKIEEKPEYDFLVNTGMYILNPKVLSLIPPNSHFDITDLIKRLKDNKRPVGVFPIDEKSWIDVGQWEEYHKSIKEMTSRVE